LEGQECLSQSSHTRFGYKGVKWLPWLIYRNSWIFGGVLIWWKVDLAHAMAMIKHIMSIRSVLVFFLAAMAVIFIAGSWQFGFSDPKTNPSDNPVVATVGGRLITLREVEKTVELPLYLLETQRQQVLRQAIQKVIDRELLDAEASRRGLKLPQLLEEASQSEAIARLASLPAPVKRLSIDGQKSSLDLQEQARIRQALLVSLRRKTDVRVTLPALEPPVLAIDPEGDRTLGSDRAPITIVEFSDFQCPYCQQSVKVIKALRQLYGERVRIVYRDYPGPNHPYALRASEAARCAGEQGKFWEYHDLLFDHQSSSNGWDFLALAKELGLQQHEFEGCLSSNRFRERIAKDVQDGLELGITSTPTFFINGRPLVGAQPLANFQALIDATLLAS
jgi:protein-disulfide isomerase